MNYKFLVVFMVLIVSTTPVFAAIFHECNEIDMSGDSGCGSVSATNIKGWHWTDISTETGDGAAVLGGLIIANSLWSRRSLTIGDLVNPAVKLNDSAYFAVSYFNQTGDLKVNNLVNTVTGVNVLDDDVKINTPLKVNGLATLGKVPFLKNSYKAITFGDDIVFNDDLNVSDLITFTAEMQSLDAGSLDLDVDLHVGQDFISDKNIKATRLKGAVMLGSNCMKDNGDGGLSMAFGCN